MDTEEIWTQIQEQFDDDVVFIMGIRLESSEEAINHTYPTEWDEDAKIEARHSLLVPHRRSDDHEELTFYLSSARDLVSELTPLFEARETTPHFLGRWGAFRFCCGYVSSCFFSNGNDLGPVRAGRAGGLQSPRLYISTCLGGGL